VRIASRATTTGVLKGKTPHPNPVSAKGVNRALAAAVGAAKWTTILCPRCRGNLSEIAIEAFKLDHRGKCGGRTHKSWVPALKWVAGVALVVAGVFVSGLR